MLTMSQKNDIRASQQKRLDDIKNGVIKEKVDHQQKTMVTWFINVYKSMPEWEKQELQGQWDRYYKLCSESTEADLFRAIKMAAKDKDDNRVQELSKQARDMLKNGFVAIPKPAGYDPMIWDNSQWANDYRVLTHILKEDDTEFNRKVTNNVF